MYYEDYEDDRGGNDEYYTEYCPDCGEVTEHDGCTGECCDCWLKDKNK